MVSYFFLLPTPWWDCCIGQRY